MEQNSNIGGAASPVLDNRGIAPPIVPVVGPHLHPRRIWPLRILGRFGLVLGALVVIYIAAAFLLRPWYVRWGATDDEVRLALPGDDMVTHPDRVSTRAITINAPAAAIWPWLVQMGQGRGGLYSYEAFENLIGCDMHNANQIIPTLQGAQVGDFVRMYPEGKGPLPYIIARMDTNSAFIMGHHPTDGTDTWFDSWAFVLNPVDTQHTRLIIRSRAMAWTPVDTVLEPGFFMMEQAMLTGIKERVERGTP